MEEIRYDKKEYGARKATEEDLRDAEVWIPDTGYISRSQHKTVEEMKHPIQQDHRVHLHAAVPGGILDRQAKSHGRVQKHLEALREVDAKRQKRKEKKARRRGSLEDVQSDPNPMAKARNSKLRPRLQHQALDLPPESDDESGFGHDISQHSDIIDL